MASSAGRTFRIAACPATGGKGRLHSRRDVYRPFRLTILAPTDSSAAADAALAAMLKALPDGRPRSGADLAGQFGITRAAVWKRVAQLRRLGVPISGRAGSGYRLEAPIDLLDARVIAEAMPGAARAALGAIDVRWRIDSTNAELKRCAALDPGRLRACLAEFQTAGRGRRGRAWQMPLGGGIALSLLHPFERGVGALGGLSLAAGIAVIDGLEQCGIGGLGLKWPNDVVAGGRKLAGILVELGGDALGPCHAVIGVGLDVRIGKQAGTAIDQPWTDLAGLVPVVPARNRIAACLLDTLLRHLGRFEAEGFTAFADAYARCDVLRGRAVRVLTASGERTGTADGIDAHGALRIVTADGPIVVDSGEVSVRGIDDGTAARLRQ